MPPGLNLERLVHFLCQLGASWAPHGLNLAVLDTSWTPLGCVQSALAALSEPIWTPRWSSELQLVLQTAKMSSNMPSSCPSRALQTFEKYGRVVKFRGPGLFAVEVLLDCIFAGLQAFLDAFWGSSWTSWTFLGLNLAPLGLNLQPLGRLLASTWGLLGASGAQLGASWVPLELNLAALGGFWASVGPTWAPSGLHMASKWPPSGLQVNSNYWSK